VTVQRGNCPVVGFGQGEMPVPPTVVVRGSSPWAVALTTSLVGATAGWVIEEIAQRVRRKQRR
jgi:hypothetical protein